MSLANIGKRTTDVASVVKMLSNIDVVDIGKLDNGTQDILINMLAGLDEAGQQMVLNSERLTPALRNNISGYLNVATAGTEAAAATTASGAAASGAAAGFSTLGAAAKGLFVTLASNPLTWVVVGTYAAIKATDYFANAYSRAAEKANEAAADYQSVSAELSSMQSEYDSTKEKIDSLRASGPLSLTDKADLENLERQNALLEKRIQIQERLESSAQKEAASQAANTLQTESFVLPDADMAADRHSANVNIVEYTMKMQEKLNGVYAEQEELLKRRAALAQKGDIAKGGADYDEFVGLGELLDDLGRQEEWYTGIVTENVSEVQKYYNQLKDSSGNVAKENESLAKSCEDLFDAVLNSVDNATKTEGKIATVLSKARFEGVRDKLMEAASSGGESFLRQTIGEVEGLEGALQSAGIPLEDFVNHILSLTGSDLGNLAEQATQLKDAFGTSRKWQTLQQFDEFLSGLDDNQLHTFYQYIKDNNLDISTWTMDDVRYNFEIAVKGADEANESITEVTKNYTSLASGIKEVQSVLSAQSTGQSISVDDLDKLGDYSDALEYVNGCYQLNQEKVTELIKAKSAEQIAINNTNKAIDQAKYIQNAAEIERLTNALSEEQYGEYGSASAVQAHIDALRSENSTLSDNINKYNLMNSTLEEATSAYQHWINAQSASQSGQMFDSALKAVEKIKNTLTNSESDDYGRVGNEDYKAALEFIIPEEVSAKGEGAIKKYIKSLDKYLTLDNDGNFKGLDIQSFCEDAVEKGLMVLDNDEFKIAGQKTMQDFADGMGLSLPFVQAMFGEMQEFGGQFDWADEAIQTIGDLGVAAYKAKDHLMSLEENSDLKLVLDVSQFESDEKAVSTLQETIQQLNNYKTKLDVDSTEYKEANSLIQYCAAQIQYITRPAVMSVDTSQVTGSIGEVLSLLQDFQTAKDNIAIQASIGADTSAAEEELAKVTAKLQKVDIPAELQIDTSSADSISQSIANLTPEMIVSVGVDSTLVDAYRSAEHDSTGTVTWGNETSAVDSYAGSMKHADGTVQWRNNTVAVKTSFTATGTVHWRNASPSGGTHTLNGTAHASGTANARGNWGAKTGGKKLVGELGREIIVDPRTGRWYTVGDNGAEIRDIPKNAIVFNHLQTESLLKNGYAVGRGDALVSGTAMVTGGIKAGDAKRSKSTGSGSKNKSSKSTKSSKKSSKKSSQKKSSKKKDSGKWSVDKLQKYIEKLFDWIEIKLDRLSSKTKSFLNNAETHVQNLNYESAASDYKKAMSATNKQIQANQQGADKYSAQANSILKKAVSKKLISQKDADSIAKKVASGKIDIAEYDEKIREVIKDYKEYYEKSLTCGENVGELLSQYNEYAEALYNLPLDKLNKQLEDIDKTKKLLEAQYDIADGSAAKNKNLMRQNQQAKKELQAKQDAASDTKSNLKKARKKLDQTSDDALKGLSKADKKEIISLAKSGQEIDWSKYSKLSLAGKEAIIAYNNALATNKEAVNDSKIASAEYTKTIRENAVQMFNNIADDYTGVINKISNQSEKLNALIDQLAAKGYKATKGYYDSIISWENQHLETLQSKRDNLQAELDKSVSDGTIQEGTKEWYDMKEAIDECDLAIIQSNTSIIELNNSIRKLSWDRFDDFQSSISDVIDEANFLIDLLSMDDLFDENGNMTEAGRATQAMHAQNYNSYMRQADEYGEEIARIDREIANDPYNVDLLERRQELIKSQRESIKSANDEKKALQDLAKDGIDSVLNKLKEMIDTYTDALDSAKDLRDYQKNLAEQSSNISSLRKQINAYGGDESEETRKTIQQLKTELAKAESDLEDTQYDRYISDTKDLLEKVYDDYESTLNERVDDIDSVIRDAIAYANQNAGSIQSTISSECSSVGTSISNAMNSIWGGSNDPLSDSPNMLSVATNLNSTINSLSTLINTIYRNSNNTNVPTGLNQYSTGVRRINSEQFAWTQEDGDETIVKPSANAILTPLARGDSVLNAEATSNLWRVANDPTQFISDKVRSSAISPGIIDPSGEQVIQNTIHLDMELPNVSNYQDFMNAARSDPKFEKLIQAMTTDRMAGRGSKAKNSIRW